MTKQQKGRNRRTYKGMLAEPILEVPRQLPPGVTDVPPSWCPPEHARSWPLAVARCRQEDIRNGATRMMAMAKRFGALCDHFEVDMARRGWARDLATRLAKQHEAEFFRGCRMSDLFDKYDINPDQPSADQDFAIAIAVRHVPGFRSKLPERPKSRLSPVEIIELIAASERVREHLKAKGGQGSDRQIAEILSDPDRLSSILSEQSARSIEGIIKSHGNQRRTNKGVLSERTLRSHMRQIRTLREDFFRNRASSYQMQILDDVIPQLRWMGRDEAQERGQN